MAEEGPGLRPLIATVFLTVPAGALGAAALLFESADLLLWAGSVQGLASTVFARELAHFQIEELGIPSGLGDVETTAFFGRALSAVVAVLFVLGALGVLG